MPVVDTTYISHGPHGTGYVDEYKTVVKSRTEFWCGCGHKIIVAGRKTKTGKDKYAFTIEHRNRMQKVLSNEPTETQIFDKMLKVSTYVACRFPMGGRGKAYRRV